MFKAILSSKDLSHEEEYYGYVEDLLNNETVLGLGEFRHHIGTTRFQHSLNVSYYNFKLCKLFHLNARSAARAGLLHDFFFYVRKEHTKGMRSHAAEHPRTALENASRMFSISDLEGDIIVNHMWPMTRQLPRYRETYVITLVDKFCAVAEVMIMAFRLTGKKAKLAASAAAVLMLNVFSKF